LRPMSKESRCKLDLNGLRSIVILGQLSAKQKLIVELL